MYASMLSSLFLIDLAAATVPGPNFILVSRSALTRGRRGLLWAAHALFVQTWSGNDAFESKVCDLFRERFCSVHETFKAQLGYQRSYSHRGI